MSEDIHKWATDGRYTLMFDEHTFFVWDNEKDKRMTALQVTKKLNEQQTILIKQEQKIKHLREVLTEIYVMSVQESIISEERSENDG